MTYYAHSVTFGVEDLVSGQSLQLPSIGMRIPNMLPDDIRRLCVTHGASLRIDYGNGAMLFSVNVVYPTVYTGVRRNLIYAYDLDEDDTEDDVKVSKARHTIQLSLITRTLVDVVVTTLKNLNVLAVVSS